MSLDGCSGITRLLLFACLCAPVDVRRTTEITMVHVRCVRRMWGIPHIFQMSSINTLIPYTMFPIESSVPRGPTSVQVQTRSGAEHVRTLLPLFLQGSSGVIQLIASFIGQGVKWVQVTGNLSQIYAQRDAYLYFIYWVFSHRLPIPSTLTNLRKAHVSAGAVASHSRRPAGACARANACVVDTGSRMLPLVGGDAGALFFTRTGHLGTSHELSHYTRLLTCRGYVTPWKPVIPCTGRHLVVTHRVAYWKQHDGAGCDSNTVVCPTDYLSLLDPTTQWDSVILDHLRPATKSTCWHYPDSRHLSGTISPDWIQVNAVTRCRKQTVVFRTLPCSDLDLVDDMYLLQATYRGERFIVPDYTRERVMVVRVAETMLLEKISEMGAGTAPPSYMARPLPLTRRLH